MQEKAYKVLAKQEKISNNAAKDLIDSGLVMLNGKKVCIARALVSEGAKFTLEKPKKSSLIFEDSRIIAVNKPFGVISQSLESEFNAPLLNRLDKETSGVILLCKDEKFREICVEEFRAQRVAKSYLAIVSGVLSEEISVNEPIFTLKSKHGAISKISKDGAKAHTIITPLLVSGKKTLIKATPITGRTHQIRVHCAFIKHPIVGDTKYPHFALNKHTQNATNSRFDKNFTKNSSLNLNAKNLKSSLNLNKHNESTNFTHKRMYLHSFEITLLDYKFSAKLDESFNEFGFDIKNLML